MSPRFRVLKARLPWLIAIWIFIPQDCHGDVSLSPILGAGSCASSTCHGGVWDRETPPTWRTSFSVWEATDPHVQSGVVLFNELSIRIAAALEPETKDSEEAFHRLLAQRCIACHGTHSRDSIEKAEAIAPLQQRNILVAGVTCESCHGQAQEWITTHTQARWLDDPQRLVPPYGMLDTEHWLPRIDVCLRCHVGSRSADGLVRDMNHDLIAAGHPQLRFEPIELMERLPPHWDSRSLDDGQSSLNQPWHEAAQWRLLGTQARLSMERMADSKSLSDIPVPEFSEFHCATCHHDLATENLQQGGERSTTAAWNPWQSLELDSSLTLAPFPSLQLRALRSQGALDSDIAELSRFEIQCLQRSEELIPRVKATIRPTGTTHE